LAIQRGGRGMKLRIDELGTFIATLSSNDLLDILDALNAKNANYGLSENQERMVKEILSMYTQDYKEEEK
jgi:hypothetical protein